MDKKDEKLDDSLLRAVAAAPSIPVPRDLATFVLLEPGTVVDDAFRIETRLGAGGMGVVYAARDLKLDREVALKLMRLDRGPAQLGAKLPDVFEREARATARVNHPNIVTLHQFGNWNGLLYLVLERLRGETLNARMERGEVSLAESLAIVEQVARALVHTHAAGIVHRDLKPANVFLLADGVVKVLDFGVSGLGRMHDEMAVSLLPTRSRSTLSLAGTPGYMAPEQWDGLSCGPHTDVFAVGVMIYQLVTGRLPFGIGRIEPSAKAPSLDGKVPPEAAELVPLVASCLDPRPAARLGDASELVARLRAIRVALGDVTGSAVAAERQGLATARVWAKPKRRVALALAGAAIALGAVLAIRASTNDADRCSQATRVDEVWGPAKRDQLATHFKHSATWDAFARVIDTYTGQWARLRESACRANDVPAQTCLDQRFGALARYLEKSRTLKPELALTSARALPAVADCSDPDYLARITHPDEPTARNPQARIPYALTIGGLGADIVHAATFFDGDLVIAGRASPETSIAGVRLQAPAGAEDSFAFVARIGRDGRVRWIQIGEHVVALALATSGDAVVVGGQLNRKARLGSVELPVPAGAGDGLLAALDGKTGAVRWFRAFGAAQTIPSVRGLRSDADGNLYAVGGFSGTATFGGTQVISSGIGAETAPYVASYTHDGTLRWVQAARSETMTTKAWAVAVEGDAVVIGAWVRGTGTLAEHTIGDKGSCLIARLASGSGEVIWIRQERGTASRCIIDAVALRGDRVAIGGRYFTSSGGFVAELALADGALRWTRPVGATEHDTPKALAFAPDGTLTVAGHFTAEAVMSGTSLTSNGGWDGFVARFGKAGEPLGAFGLGGASTDVVRWIAYGPQGQLLAGGRFDTAMRVADRTLRAIAGLDGYVVELSPAVFTVAPSPPASAASP